MEEMTISSDPLSGFVNIFEPALIEELKEHGRFMDVKAGDVILDIGDNIKMIPIVLSGHLKVSRIDEDGKELLLYYVSANESCAMTFTCCMDQQISEIKAIAEEDSRLFVIPTNVMDQWIVKYSTWKTFIMRTMHARFNEMLHTIDQIAFQKLDDRLIRYLKEKSKATGSTIINLSHDQIAVELATSRVVISRLLKKLENEKRVILYRNQIKVMSAL